MSSVRMEEFKDACKFLQSLHSNKRIRSLNISEMFKPSELAYSGNKEAIEMFQRAFAEMLKRNKKIVRITGRGIQLGAIQNEYPWRLLVL